MHPLEGVNLKVARARKHLADLRGEIDAFLLQEPYDVVREVRDGGRVHEFTVRIIMQPYPWWSASVGDVVTNLRAALDHLAWQLVLAAGNQPTRKTSFPICETRPANGLTVDGGVTPDVLATIDEIQPYNQADPKSNHLAVLNRLVNIDKHRVLLLTAFAIEFMSYGTPPGILGKSAPVSQPLEDGQQVAVIEFDPPQPDLDPEAQFNIAVVLAEPLDLGHVVPVVNLLDSISWWVGDYVVEQHFAGSF